MNDQQHPATTAPSQSALRIGTAPDSWGVWFPDDPKQVPWARFLDEAAASGYTWIELGPYGYLPTDPNQLADELAQRELKLAGGTVFTAFHRSAAEWEAAWGQAVKVADLVSKLGVEHMVVIPALWRSEASSEIVEPRTLSGEQWSALTAAHDRLGKALLEEYGIHQDFHSHADSHIGTTSELTRFIEATDPQFTNLCLDTGHFAYYGGDNLALIEKYPERIGYLHLKQVDPAMLFDVLENDVPFAQAVTDGIMVEPPAGIPDFAPIIEAVAAINPEIFAIVEQDMYGCDTDAPLPIARRTREHIFGCSHFARQS